MSTTLPPDERQSPALPTSPRLRLDYIDGLRGLAILMVLICHWWYVGRWQINVIHGQHRLDIGPALSYMRVGVNLFLVLSGFCLYWPFVNRGGRREPTLWEFARKRCLRIAPPYYIALGLFTGLTLLNVHAYADDAHLLKSVAWHLAMLHNLRPDYVQDINGVFWSLALECQLYVLFPLFVEAFRRYDSRMVVLAALIVSVACRECLIRSGCSVAGNDLFALPYSVFCRFGEFVLGMFAAAMVARRHTSGTFGVRPLDLILLLIVFGMAAHQYPHHDRMEANEAICAAPFFDIAWASLFVLILLLASRTDTWLHRLLSVRWIVSLGSISYSVYLVHLPLLNIAHNLLGGFHLSTKAQMLTQAFLIMPALVAIGYTFHLMAERPFMPGHPKTGKQAAQAAIVSPAP